MLHLQLKSGREAHLRDRKQARIILKGYSDDEENDVCLSASCTSYAEVERDVNFLKRELDEVLAKAKRQFVA
jgi:hypothetical protein